MYRIVSPRPNEPSIPVHKDKSFNTLSATNSASAIALYSYLGRECSEWNPEDVMLQPSNPAIYSYHGRVINNSGEESDLDISFCGQLTSEVTLPSPPPPSASSSATKALSMKLSRLLRHDIHKHNLTSHLQADGYIQISIILKLAIFTGITFEEIKAVVATNDKQRFTIKVLPNKHAAADCMFIRANQGHSVEGITAELLLTPLLSSPVCYHGTSRTSLPSIMKVGLLRMRRKHIHLSSSKSFHSNTSNTGIRKRSNAVISVNVQKAIDDGVLFFSSSNDVILTEGPLDRRYFESVQVKGTSGNWVDYAS